MQQGLPVFRFGTGSTTATAGGLNCISRRVDERSMMLPATQPGGLSPAGYGRDKSRSIGLSYGIHGLLTTLRPNTTAQEFVVSEFIPNHFADGVHMRNFITSSAEAFAQGRIEYYKSGPLSSEKLQQLSRNYRAILLDLVQSLNESQELDAAMLYTHLDFVWHFCEIMFILSNQDLPILPYLMPWVQQNFDISPEILAELGPQLSSLIPQPPGTSATLALSQTQIKQNVGKIWDIIYLYTFHGRTADAAKLLPYTNVNKSKSYEEQIGLLEELMRKKPVYTPLSVSIAEFESAWYVWREECENRLNQKAFHGSEELVFLVKVLCGDADGFKEARRYIKTWYEYLIMLLNYQFPVAKPPMLKVLARKAIDEYADGSSNIQLMPIEEIIVAAMHYDIVGVLKEILEHFQHPWFVLHFSDLLFSGGIQREELTEAETEIDYQSILLIRDDVLLEYGTSLMQHASLWEVGIKYLAAASERQGWAIIGQLLRRRKPTTQYEAEKLIKVAEDYGFIEEAQGICKEVAREALRQDRVQQALLWSIRSCDIPLTTHIVDKILADDNEVLNITPILTIHASKLYSCGERLLFLKSFSEFRHALNKKQYEHAIVRLCQLIHDQLIPKRMSGKVLVYLHHFADIGFKFRPEEVSTLTEYIHTKIGRDAFEPEEFVKLNQVLVMNRAHCLLQAFHHVRDEKQQANKSIMY